MNDIQIHAGMEGQQVTRYTPGQPSRAPADIPRVTIGSIQGVTRYTAGEDAASAPAQGSLNGSSRASGGTDQGVFRHGGMGNEGAQVHRVTSADLAPAQGGILATLQNNAGSPTSTISPTATVELPGMGRTSVKVAATLGFLTMTADGRYVEAGRGNVEGGLQAQGSQGEQQAANAQEQQQQQDSEGPALFDSIPAQSGGNLEELYAGHIAGLEQSAYDAMLSSGLAVLSNGGDLESIVGNLTGRHETAIIQALVHTFGVDDPSLEGDTKAITADYIRDGAAVWQMQADRHVKAAGHAPEEFYDWARSKHPNELWSAVQGQLFTRSLKGYTGLLREFSAAKGR
jgi:hypothetical protein